MSTPRIDIDLLAGPLPVDVMDAVALGGGQAVFIGRTRDETHDVHGPLLALEYELHEPLVRSILMKLASKACADHALLGVRIRHASGVVPVGGASVVIDVIAAHRAEAFAACRVLIDELKARAPIFKHERWTNSTTWAKGTPPPGAHL